ncbi:MAG TPA: glycosyl hydrolase [Terriglobia bacterium]|nr:glycosyl hydrolase [Terriglobia bacterium]
MIQIDFELSPQKLRPSIERLFELSAAKIRSIEQAWDPASGPPVVTAKGKYQPREWTDWTRGFQYGSALLHFDATGEAWFLECGREGTRKWMESYITHIGVHDHGFNVISTFGNLARLAGERKTQATQPELDYYRLALKTSGAVQAARWSRISGGGGYIYSFNGAHSMFVDTIRSLRSLAIAHQLGYALHEESDRRVSLLERLVQHADATARYAVYYGEGRDHYDVRGRVAHESLFNARDGRYRCPNVQQGYSPFTTWTRGLAWAILGFAEQLEFIHTLPAEEFDGLGGLGKIEAMMLRAAEATADFYLEQTPTDGVPYWDTGAPGLAKLGDYLSRPSDPFNGHEPVDSSAASIGAQGLWLLGRYLEQHGQRAEQGGRYCQAALTVARTLLAEPYLSTDAGHQGLILHSIYHRPRGWDYVPEGRKAPCGESCMWGDYHARELALVLLREARQEQKLYFFNV